jgi:hypothetical protein
MSWVKRILGIDIPEAKEIIKQQKAEHDIALAHQMTQRAQQEEASRPKVIANLTFNLTRDGDVQVGCEWNDKSKEMGEVFGQFVHHICSGGPKLTIGHLLSQAAIQDITNKCFVNAAVEKWMEMEGEEDTEPLVNSLGVFQTSLQELSEQEDDE